jgi:cytochrome c
MKFHLLVTVCGVLLASAVGGAHAQTLDERLASADPQKGANVYKKCRACHTVDEGGPHRVGPNLWGVVGRPVASAPGYTRYSQSLKDVGGTWDPEVLDAYLENPKAVAPRGIMAFAGLKKPDDRANLIVYLNENGPEPLEFGAAAPEAPGTETAAATAEAEDDYGLLVNEPGVAETHAYCTPCHSEMIVVQQGKTRQHWADLFDWMVEEQGMAEIDEPDRSIVLDYLAAHYNEDRPNFPQR